MTSPAPNPSGPAARIQQLAANDPQLQQLLPDEAVIADVVRPDQTLAGIVSTILSGYGSRPALGERRYEVADDGTGRRVRRWLPEFETITYHELERRVRAVATVWQHDDGRRVEAGQAVVVLGFASTDYVTLDLTCAMTQAMAVPLQTSLAGQDLQRIIVDTEPVLIAATANDLVVAAELASGQPSVHTVIAFDLDMQVDADREQWDTAQAQLSGTAAELISIEDLVAAGSERPWAPLPPVDDPERMALLIHSSGSTGTPKGAIVTERHARFQFTNMPRTPMPTVRLCFAPLNHFQGRGAVFNTIARGGTVFFTANADMSTLFEDWRLVRPTEAVVFPRVLEMVYRHFLSEVARLASADPTADDEVLRQQVMDEMRYTFLGDRITALFGGSAPTTPEVRDFVKACFPVAYAEGYGTTEAGGSVTVRDRINRSEVLDYRLQDVPELGYYSTDKPYPRGELCVKTRLAIPGYFKNPEATATLFDEDGFLRTGDIMEERAPDHLVYIDRRNDVLKLAQGEFVTLGAVGTLFETHSEVIRQIFVYGSSARAFLLAVVVPDSVVLERRLGPDRSDAQVKELIRTEMARVAQEQSMRSFEVPRDFIVETEPFSQENGLLSSVSKRMRPRLLERYGERLEQMYEDLERKQHADIVALRDPDSGLSVIERIGRALAATLSLDEVDTEDRRSFAEAGGDSLGAASFAALLSDIFDVEVDVNLILSPAGHPATWAAAIEKSLTSAAEGRPTARTVHGDHARRLSAEDLDITRLIPDVGDMMKRQAPRPAAEEPRCVFITGATGFLGRFLCLEWLERLAPLDGTVICLVRARDNDEALARMRATFAGDDELASRFGRLEQHLEVVVGDIGDERLGLDAATWDRLADQVDRIVHPGALVNHVLTYEDLFAANVMGTAELVALALTDRVKPLDFVSSIAVVPYLDKTGGVRETSALAPTIEIKDRYSAHYGASKWAGEAVLHSAHKIFGLPVTIFRGDMMLPHRQYHRQVNAPDVFARLLQSLVRTGVAPESFYLMGSEGTRPKAHYDGLPVDFIASAIVAVALGCGSGIETFHVVNPHEDDGISLDTIVDWIEDAGYPIQRVEAYDDWFRRFENALHALPDVQRQRSSLSVIDSLRHPAPAEPKPVGSERFAQAVRRTAPEPEIPHLSAEFIAKCLDDLARLELIPEPAAVT
jgi:fatty acid CoA ligase FadD9